MLNLDEAIDEVLVIFVKSMMGFGTSIFDEDCAWYLKLPKQLDEDATLQRLQMAGCEIASQENMPEGVGERTKVVCLEILSFEATESNAVQILARFVTAVEWTSGFAPMLAVYAKDRDRWQLVRFEYPSYVK